MTYGGGPFGRAFHLHTELVNGNLLVGLAGLLGSSLVRGDGASSSHFFKCRLACASWAAGDYGRCSGNSALRDTKLIYRKFAGARPQASSARASAGSAKTRTPGPRRRRLSQSITAVAHNLESNITSAKTPEKIEKDLVKLVMVYVC